ncbi:MAG: DUF6512 family protein [Eubacterium sp.]
MNKKLKKFTIMGIIFTIIVGSLLHFLYDWFNHNPAVSIFAPVNESTWEHLKLVFYPMIIYAIYYYFKSGHTYPNYSTATAIGIVSAMAAIIILFYTYTGIIGKSILWVDISIFVIATIIGYIIIYIMLKDFSLKFISPGLGIVLIEFIFLMFVYFTMSPPDLNLFKAP